MVAVAGSDKEMWQTGVGVFLPGSPLANDAGMEVLNGKRDLEKVKRELKSAGYKDEKVVILGVTDLANLKAEGDVGSDMLMKSGMNVDYQTMDWGTVVARRAKKEPPEQGGWNIFFTGWGGIDMLNPVGHLSLRGNGLDSWFGWPTAPKPPISTIEPSLMPAMASATDWTILLIMRCNSPGRWRQSWST